MRALTYFSTCLTPLGTEAALWLLLALPFAGALACGLLAAGPSGGRPAAGRLAAGRLSAGRLSAIVGAAAVVATFVVAAAMVLGPLLSLPEGGRLLRSAPDAALFTVGGLRVTFGLFLDPLAAVMVLVVSGLGALIHLYAVGYMRADPAQARFFAFLNLFVGSMLLLVLGDGFAPLFFGWEGVGMCSYFLIGFWHRRPGAVEAATKAFIVNRVGDAALILGVGLVMWGLANVGSRPGEIGTLEVEPRGAPASLSRDAPIRRRPPKRKIPVGPTLSFAEMRDQIGVEIALPPSLRHSPAAETEAHVYPARALLARMTVAGLPLSFVACFLIFLGAAGKSAQLPFSAWLPDAMAGPTPVSALIHAATMVTAGVYLLARLGFLFALSPGAVTVVVTAGTLTALGAAAAALFQNDLKRVLAYSTISQLGYMFAAVAGGGSAGIFHVVTHGFFKACLFLAAGVIIHAVGERLGVASHGTGTENGAASPPADPQDLRHMGGLAAALPWTRRAYLVACLGLAGFPVASGFFSKDQIFAAVATAPYLKVAPSLVLGALAVTTFLTACYAFRSYYLVFSGPPAGAAPAVHGEPRLLVGITLVLAAGALVVGPWLGWPSNWTADHGAPRLARFLDPVFAGNFGAMPPVEVRPAIEWGLQAGGVVLAILGLVVARGLSRPDRGRATALPVALGRFFADGARLDVAYRVLAVRPALALARSAAWLDRRVFDRAVDGVAAVGVAAARLVGLFDRHVVDGAVDGVSAGVIATGRRAARLQNGRINVYVVVLAAGVAGLVVLVYFFSS